MIYFIAFVSTEAKIEDGTITPGVSNNLVLLSSGTEIVSTVVPGYGEVEIIVFVSFLYIFNNALINEDFPTDEAPII